jgi:hypothetical protein
MSESDSKRFEGKAHRVSPPHHVGFNEALERAVAQAAKDPDWPVGETRSFSIGLTVDVVKTNPGWIGGYGMTLTPTG